MSAARVPGRCRIPHPIVVNISRRRQMTVRQFRRHGHRMSNSVRQILELLFDDHVRRMFLHDVGVMLQRRQLVGEMRRIRIPDVAFVGDRFIRRQERRRKTPTRLRIRRLTIFIAVPVTGRELGVGFGVGRCRFPQRVCVGRVGRIAVVGVRSGFGARLRTAVVRFFCRVDVHVLLTVGSVGETTIASGVLAWEWFFA